MIRANFNAYNAYVTDSLYQWDINQDLVISGLNLSVTPEIHFANADMDRAIVGQATLVNGVVTVRIPNSLLQSNLTIKVYIGIYENDTFKVIEIIEIPVIAKEKPTDYTIEDTDGEIYSFKNLENTVTNAVNQFELRETALRGDLGKINDTVNTALNIARGKNQAHVFSTTEDLYSWLSNPENARKYQVGDNLYIVALDVPDWWVSEVLTEADEDTGFYYKIAPLETQKVDLTNIHNDITSLKIDYIVEQNMIPITQTLSDGSSVSVEWTYTKWKSGRCELYGITIRPYDFSGYDITGGNIIRSDAMSILLPFKVYDKRTFFDCNDVNAWVSSAYDGNGENYATYVLWRRYDYTNVNYEIFVRVLGRWK